MMGRGRNRKVDLLIIGAGPAGSAAAYVAASAGKSVLVVERAVFPRKKLCGGLLTQKSIDLIAQKIGLTKDALYQFGSIVDSADHFAISVGNGSIKTHASPYPFCFVDREAFDHQLASAAKVAGAELLFGTKVRQLDIKRGRVVLSDGSDVEFGHLVAADGANSFIRGQLIKEGAPGISAKMIKARMAESVETFVLKPEKSLPLPILYLGCPEWGFGWVFPHGKQVVLGILDMKKRHHPSIVDKFRKFLQRFDFVKGAVKINGHPLPYGNYLETLGYKNILLTGDAACLADPLTGEGIYQAVRSGVEAAEAIISHSENALEIYVIRIKNSIIFENKWARFWSFLSYFRPYFFRNFVVRFLILPLFSGIFVRIVHGKMSYSIFRGGLSELR